MKYFWKDFKDIHHALETYENCPDADKKACFDALYIYLRHNADDRYFENENGQLIFRCQGIYLAIWDDKTTVKERLILNQYNPRLISYADSPTPLLTLDMANFFYVDSKTKSVSSAELKKELEEHVYNKVSKRHFKKLCSTLRTERFLIDDKHLNSEEFRAKTDEWKNAFFYCRSDYLLILKEIISLYKKTNDVVMKRKGINYQLYINNVDCGEISRRFFGWCHNDLYYTSLSQIRKKFFINN